MQSFSNSASGAIVLRMADRIVENRAYLSEIDGKIGESSRAAIRAFQERRGLEADGHPSKEVLTTLRGR